MSQPGDTDILVQARGALLDALDALSDHRPALVLIGAQAIYLQTGAAPVALAETTKDTDIAIDPRVLHDDPRLEVAMRNAGFHHNPIDPQPGCWISKKGIPVDLMVPEQLAGPKARRGAPIPPHSNDATRRASGLEATLVDHAPRIITALDPRDSRSLQMEVAGPAALLVAKLHKLGERQDTPRRLLNKDAHDVYRLLVATETAPLAAAMQKLLGDELSASATIAAMDFLATLFSSGPDALGATMAGRAEDIFGNAATVAPQRLHWPVIWLRPFSAREKHSWQYQMRCPFAKLFDRPRREVEAYGRAVTGSMPCRTANSLRFMGCSHADFRETNPWYAESKSQNGDHRHRCRTGCATIDSVANGSRTG